MSVKRKPAQSKLWAGRFHGKTDPQVETFMSSLAIDRRLYRYDIAGSIAHCRTLERAGVLTRREADKLFAGLKQVEKEIADGRFRFRSEERRVGKECRCGRWRERESE